MAPGRVPRGAAALIVFRRFSPSRVAGEGLRRVVPAVRETGCSPGWGQRVWAVLFFKFSFRSRFVGLRFQVSLYR